MRTFAVAWRRAREAGGAVLLRIDDLDPQRSRAEFVSSAMEDLRWLGLAWDGEPWLQSGRGEAYRAAWAALVAAGCVYPCGCSRRELQEVATAPHEGAGVLLSEEQTDLPDVEPLYPGTCQPRWLPGEAEGEQERASWLEAGPEGRNWRFRINDGEPVEFADGGMGGQGFVAGREFGDFAVWRRDGVAAYQLATVVDDAAMGVTEVVRGADLLLSTARQMLLYRALFAGPNGLRAPAWWHCPLVVDGRGERLAKRSDGMSVRALRESGLSAEQVLHMAEEALVG